jgi:molybdopterin molybdotransferase
MVEVAGRLNGRGPDRRRAAGDNLGPVDNRAGDAAPAAVAGRRGCQPLPWDAARELASRAAGPLPPVSVPLPAAGGAVLAEPLLALVALPPFDRCAMDGYAVCCEPPWTVVGRVLAGEPAAPTLRPGEACEVATGALLPGGATAVLPVEQARRRAGQVSGQVTAGDHIRRAGEECVPGEELLPAGARVSPQVLGLAAAVGYDRLLVRPAPAVTALVTGDELVHAGLPGEGLVRDAIGPALPGLVGAVGGRLVASHPVPDRPAALTRALGSAGGDLVLVSGSSSAGRADHLRTALDAVGATLLVDGVDCRPGHPQSLARLPDGRLVVGLPGNPLAALVAFLTLAEPACAALRGLAPATLVPVAAPTLTGHPTCTRLVPVRVRDGVATPVGHAGSAMLRGVAAADALAVVPARGDPGPVRLLPLPAVP